MKIGKLGLLACAVLLSVSLLHLGKAAAAGGAGEQSTAITINALAAVNSATTIANLDTAVQSFLNQYSVTFSTNQVSDTADFGSTSLTNSDFAATQNFDIEFIQEWSKYTPAWISASGLTTVYAVNNLSVLGADQASQSRCASYSTSGHFMVYEASCSGAELYMREIIHHEYAHYLISHHTGGSPIFNGSTWSGYNTPGFSYGNGGASCYDNPASCLLGDHPIAGFVSGYATSAIAEDQAETYAYLFATNQYQLLSGWLNTDSILTQKANLLKSFISSIDSSMDDTYFASIQGYATTHNITISAPFSGPGTQSFVPETGDLVWTIPANGSSASGIGIGGDVSKQTLILDGAITGCVPGRSGGVEVMSGGTLMGSGSACGIFVDPGGILAPGHSPGCLSSGNLTINGAYQAEIGGTSPCTGYDQMQVTGTVDVTNATLSTSLYNGYQPKDGESYIIISNDGSDPVTGTFNGLPEGSTLNVNGDVFKISYTGGDGNDVVLTVTGTSTDVGDVNGDSHVDNADLTIFLTNWHTSISSCDFNRDGTADILDLSILLAHYGS